LQEVDIIERRGVLVVDVLDELPQLALGAPRVEPAEPPELLSAIGSASPTARWSKKLLVIPGRITSVYISKLSPVVRQVETVNARDSGVRTFYKPHSAIEIFEFES
jgi:hypothetical protein